MAMIAGGLLAAPLAAGAQPTGKIWRIGILWASSSSRLSGAYAALRQGLREFGYVEGQNIVVENRYAEDRRDPDRVEIGVVGKPQV